MQEIASKLLPEDTEEKCGLVLKDGTVLDVINHHSNPAIGFHICADDLFAHEENLAGTWHTHPNDTANLSQQDYVGFRQWPEIRHYIVGIDGVRAYDVVDGLIVEVDL
jgi:proteasome lid subunit RPN8/RPN11